MYNATFVRGCSFKIGFNSIREIRRRYFPRECFSRVDAAISFVDNAQIKNLSSSERISILLKKLHIVVDFYFASSKNIILGILLYIYMANICIILSYNYIWFITLLYIWQEDILTPERKEF